MKIISTISFFRCKKRNIRIGRLTFHPIQLLLPILHNLIGEFCVRLFYQSKFEKQIKMRFKYQEIYKYIFIYELSLI